MKLFAASRILKGAISLLFAILLAIPAFADTQPVTIGAYLLNSNGENIPSSRVAAISYTGENARSKAIRKEINTADNMGAQILHWGMFRGKSFIYFKIPALKGSEVTITVPGYAGLTLSAKSIGEDPETAPEYRLEEVVSGILVYDEKPVSKMKRESLAFSRVRAERVSRIKALSAKAEIKRHYHIFDGIHVKIPKKDLSKLNSLQGARFYPARRLKLVLHDSVPQINADILHGIGLDGTGVKVAVTDTGIDYNHPALAGKIDPLDPAQCYAFINNGEESTDCFDQHGHGTHVFGTIASQDSYYKGVAPGAQMMAIRVFHNGIGYDPDLVRAIEYAVDNGADVINMSLVTVVDPDLCVTDPSIPCTCYDAVTSLASDNAVAAGVIMVGGAGNEYRVDGVEAPACSDKTIAVGAVDKLNNYADFSSGGEDLDVVAPGVGIFSTILGGGFSGPEWSGTSMAAPHVSGMAALLLQAEGGLSPEQMMNLLRSTALDLGDPGFDIFYGYGLVDAYAAYDAVTNPAPEYLDFSAFKDSSLVTETQFFDTGDVVYIEATATDLIWREIPGLAVEARVYFNSVLQETIPLVSQGGGAYRGSFDTAGRPAGVYDLTVEASNADGTLLKTSEFHLYGGSGVSAYYMNFKGVHYIIENQHLICVFNESQSEGTLKFLMQKEDLLFYNFLDSAQGTSRGGIHSTGPLNVVSFSTEAGEGLPEANIDYDVMSVLSTGYDPPLDSTPSSCGADCNSCSNHVLTGGCQYENCSPIDEYIQDIQVNGTVFAPGQTISVTVTYRCSDLFSSVDALSISYNDGSGWEVVKCYDFYATEPEGCVAYGGGMHSTTIDLQLSDNPGTHYIRASMSLGSTCPFTCSSSGDGDNDEIAITVAQEIVEALDAADLNIKVKDGGDYLVYTLNNLNENFPNFFYCDVIGTLGSSYADDRYHLQDGTDDVISTLMPNMWRDFASDYLAVYDETVPGDGVDDNVVSFVRFQETSNMVFNKAGALNELDREGARIKYQTAGHTPADEARFLLVFTKGSWQDIEDDMPDVALGTLPVSFHDFSAAGLKGDFNGDGYIDYNDLFAFVACWHAHSGDPNYNAIADFNDDGYIDYEDLFAFVAIWHTYPSSAPSQKMALAKLASAESAAATIAIAPSVKKVAADGEEFDIEVRVSGVTDLHNVNFDLALNANALEVLSITEGIFLSSAGETVFLADQSNPALINVSTALLGTEPGPSGDGVLTAFHIRLKDINELPSAVALQNLVLKDHNNQDILFQSRSGWVVSSVATISISPPQTIVSASGETFAVEVIVSDIADLHNVNFDLRFDAAALEVLSITEGAFLPAAGETVFLTDDSAPAFANVSTALLGADPGASSEGALATFHMRVKDTGALPCNLSLQNVVLRDHSNGNILFLGENGSVALTSGDNLPPALDPIGDKSVDENHVLAFTVTASDPDPGDTVTLSVSGLPAGASFTPASGAFGWTPAYDQAGEYPVTFTATDDGVPNLSDSETITITVNNVNRAPILDPVGDKSVDENQPLAFTVTASDPDAEDTVALSASVLPAGASFTPATGAFDWTPTYDQSGSYDVTFTATDDGVPVLTDSETITITVDNVNRAPVLDPIGDKSVLQDSALAFTITASDPDDDGITFSPTGLPAGASLGELTGQFSWTPTADQVGLHDVTFIATDDGTPNLSDEETITITVVGVSTQEIVPGYNLVCVPFEGAGLPDAESLALAIPNCTAVWRWDAVTQSWSGHPKGGPNNFPVTPGGAYLASAAASGTFESTGQWASPSFALKAGYDLISLPKSKDSITTAEGLLQDIPNCTAIWRWDAASQTWNGHPAGGPNNFAVEPGRAYLISVTADGAWP